MSGRNRYGMLASQNYICIFEEENVIVGVIIPDGYSQVYGEILDENRKAKTCHYGFHPEET